MTSEFLLASRTTVSRSSHFQYSSASMCRYVSASRFTKSSSPCHPSDMQLSASSTNDLWALWTPICTISSITSGPPSMGHYDQKSQNDYLTYILSILRKNSYVTGLQNHPALTNQAAHVDTTWHFTSA